VAAEAAPVAEDVGEEVVKKVAKRKGPKAVFSVFDDISDPEEATKVALSGGHLKRAPAGPYIGAPRGVGTPQALGKLRRDAVESVGEGAWNADWYDRQRALAQALAPDDPAAQSLFARGTAAYSPQAMPKVELPAFLRQHNEAVLTGDTMA